MIEQAPEIIHYVIFFIVSVLIGGVISFHGVFNTNSLALSILPITISFIIVFTLSFGFVIPLQNEYEQQVQLEIESATCEQLPLMYEEYSLFQEKIKSKYIFDCVADKQDLEWIR